MDKNGVSLIGNEDMDNIKVWVSNTTPIPVTFSDTGSKESKKKSRILPGINASTFASLTTLEDIIPNGFMLLHNDLTALLEKLGAGGKGEALSTASATGVGAALGAGAAGLVKGLFSGFGDDSQKHLEEIAEKLNMGLTVEDFEDDPDIRAIQIDSFKSYLKTYYAEQIAAMAGQAAGSFVSEAVVSAITGVVGGLLEAVGLKDEGPASKLESIATDLDASFTTETITSDETAMSQVRQIQKDSMVTYLKTYYAAQISGMAGETVGNAFGGLAKGLIEGTIGTLFNIFTDRDDEATSLAKIAETLTSMINTTELAKEKEVQDVQRNSIIQYLKLYYQSQINEMAGDTIASTLHETIKGVLVGVLGGVFSIFSGGKKDEQANSLATIVSTLDSNLSATDYTNDDDVKKAHRDAVVNYLKIYYAAQISELAAEGVGKTVGAALEGFVDSVSNIISGIFGGRDQEEEKTHLQTIVDDITRNIKAEDYTSDETVLRLQRNTVLEYLRVYYNAQLSELKASSDKGWFGNLLENAGESIGGFFSGLLGKDKQSPFLDAVNSIISIDPNQYRDLPEIKAEIGSHLVDAIKIVLDEQNTAIADWFSGDVDRDTQKALKDFRNAYNAAFTSSVGSIDMSNLFGGAQSNKDSNVISIKDKVTTINIRLLNILNAINELNAKLPAVTVVPVPAGSQNEDLDLLEG